MDHGNELQNLIPNRLSCKPVQSVRCGGPYGAKDHYKMQYINTVEKEHMYTCRGDEVS